jgi:endoglycosylceramidase
MPKPLVHPLISAMVLTVPLGCRQEQPAENLPAFNPLELRPLSVSSDLRIVDDQDRDVLLRGVNITSLGEYWQGSPGHPPTLPTTPEDWNAMAASGISVIRLVVHWSRLEPERGRIDEAHLDEIDAYITEAASYGIYSVIDMHQDAYSAFIYTEEGATCPEGTSPGKGWDGAPAWATLTDGLSACIEGDRNSAPAVLAAWNHFYDNTDGIQDHFVDVWGAIAARFAGRPEVAGYDLLNEPETSRPSTELAPIYNQLLADCTEAIREAEADAPFEHLLFIEPTIPAADFSMGVIFPNASDMGVDGRNLVGASHNYAESIGGTGLTVEQTNDLYMGLADTNGTAHWTGEYGFWSTSTDVLEVAARFAADEDRHAIGGAWWQWRQPCGDPHSLYWSGERWLPYDEIIHLNTFDCTTGTDLGPTEDFLALLGRGYPRAAPGRIASLTSDPFTNELTLEGVASNAGQRLVLWTPTLSSSHEVSVEGLVSVEEHAVEGGRLITAKTASAGDYWIRVASP